MNLIIFDLEWNIGYQPKMLQYHGSEITFRGEIIQIGAVKVDENANVLDTFEMTLRPRIFRKLQHRIAQVTGMSQGELDAGVPIKQGLAEFVRWAGPDAVFGEWGLDDVPVLKQNLFMYDMDESWPAHWYDLQRVFLSEFPRQEGEGMTLESVVQRMNIPVDQPFHRALDDAMYTVKVCRKLTSFADALEAYPREDALLREAILTDEEAEYFDFRTWMGHVNRDDYKTDPEIQTACCPVCGAKLTPDEVWLKRGNTGYYTLASCAQHGPWFLRFKLSRRDGLHWNFARCLEAPRPDTLEKWNKQRAQFVARLQKRAEKQAEKETAAAQQ